MNIYAPSKWFSDRSIASRFAILLAAMQPVGFSIGYNFNNRATPSMSSGSANAR